MDEAAVAAIQQKLDQDKEIEQIKEELRAEHAS